MTEAKLKAEDYEAAIVMGFYTVTKRVMESTEDYGIKQQLYDKIENTPSAKKTGELIATKILKDYPQLKNKKAEVFGRTKSSLTDFWKSYDASDTTPKTDVKIGDKNFSVKIGLAQLMSGGKAESTATFQAAVKNSNSDLVKSPQYKKTNQVLEGFVKNTLAPSKIRPLIKAGTNKVVNAAEKAHKDCMKELGNLFNQSKEFKIEFAREAMSGYEKFGKSSPASADLMLVSTADGGKVEIHDVNDDSYCEKIATAMKLQTRFKTSQRTKKELVSPTNEKGGTGEYFFWSVISLIVDSMTEELDTNEKETLVEFNILNKVKSFVSKTWSKVTNFFKKGLRQLTSFLGAIPDIRVKRNVKF
ncbi:MAG: hypothetical protein CMA63_00395 [Euryarchaeota archaeon]|nr:hypothetical protein [Euryarchaeota archaeon]